MTAYDFQRPMLVAATLATLYLGLFMDPDWNPSGWLNLGILSLCAVKLMMVKLPTPYALIGTLTICNWLQSTIVLWLALASMAIYWLIKTPTGSHRAWLWLWLACAVQPPIAALGLKWGSAWILAADAQLTALLLSSVGYEVQAVGNLIQHKVHSVLVLVGCSSIHGLAELTLMTATTGLLLNIKGSCYRTAVAVAMFFAVTINLIRLASMTINPQWHTWWHSDAGVQAYQGLSLGLFVLVLGYQFLLRRTSELSA